MTIASDVHPFPNGRSVFDVFLPQRYAGLKLNRTAKIVLAIVLLLALWAVAIVTFGVPAFVWPMRIIVPAMVIGLVMLVWGM